MELDDPIAAFQALAHDTRLRAFRLLVAAGPEGEAAGAIAGALGVPASTLSSHLSVLERAGLIRSWRVQRNIFYAVNQDGTRAMIDFLTRDCCRGNPELCGFSPRRTAASRKRKASA